MTEVRSLYRLQLRPDFPFARAEELAPYFSDLGVSHLYLSPILEARRGSAHGYDGTDPTRIRSELGGAAGWRRLSRVLRSHGLGAVVDIVPNHLAASPETPAWWSVLAEGKASPFSRFFDIDWQGDSGGRLILPVLPAPLDRVLETGGLRLVAEDRGLLLVLPSGIRLPLARPTVEQLVTELQALLPAGVRGAKAAGRWLVQLARSTARRDGDLWGGRRPLLNSGRRAIERALQTWGSGPGARGRWVTLLAGQRYVLVTGTEGHRSVNYRRFFQVSELVGLRVESPRVFAATHRVLLDQVAQGLVDGVRVDHVDGLNDPVEYLRRLTRALGPPAGRSRRAPLVWVEKILTGDERLPPTWPVAGTTGYEFLRRVNELFVDLPGYDRLRTYWEAMNRDRRPVSRWVDDAKRGAIEAYLRADVARVGRAFRGPARRLCGGPVAADRIENWISAFLRALPVYRTYRALSRPGPDDASIFRRAWRAFDPDVARQAGQLAPMMRALLEGSPDLPRTTSQDLVRAVRRLQQLEPAAMAKGFEDRATYRYTPLTSLCEVGGSLVPSSHSQQAFHAENLRAARRWPQTLRTTSTHDTKRSEDVRARLNAATGIPDQYRGFVRAGWRETHMLQERVGAVRVPDARLWDFLAQTLVAAWPLDDSEARDFPSRMSDYAVKALREAGVSTNWDAPNIDFENAVRSFVDELLRGAAGRGFRRLARAFVDRIAPAGAANSLVQVAFKLTVPGTPDVYQGCELWDLSLVDPDNRRPIDFPRRRSMLDQLDPSVPVGQAELARWFRGFQDGRIKLYLTSRLLHLRQDYSALGTESNYRPVMVSGGGDVVAYARQLGHEWVLIVGSTAPFRFVPGSEVALALPPSAPATWTDALSGEEVLTRPDGPGARAGRKIRLGLPLRVFSARQKAG
jgi:(1->4)-alpha-D-glucan 1-alpha-D-glucosylmutase